MKLSELEIQIQQLEGEIASLESAQQALVKGLPRPVEPVGDNTFEMLKSLMKVSENPEEQKQERQRAIAASQETLKQARKRLAEMKAQLEQGTAELSQAIGALRAKAEKMQRLSLELEADWLELLELAKNPAFHQFAGSNPLYATADRRALPEIVASGELCNFRVSIRDLESAQIFTRIQAVIAPINQPEAEAA